MEALAAAGQHRRGAARVRPAAHAAARRARDHALARGACRPRAAAPPRPAAQAARPPSAPRAGRRDRAPAELLVRAQAPLVGRDARAGRAGRLWCRRVTGGVTRRGMPARRGWCCSPATPGSARRGWWRSSPRRAHDDGAVVLAGRSPEEALLPYQPFLEALRHYVVGVPSRELRATRARVRRRAGAAGSRAPPPRPGAAVPGAGEPETERYRLFEAVVGLLREISDARAGAARARRPPMGRPADAAAAASPGPGARPGSAADSRRLPRHRGRPIDGFADALGGAAPRAAWSPRSASRGLAERETAELVTDPGRAGAVAPRWRGPCTPRPRATRSSSRRSSGTWPRPGCGSTAPARRSCSGSGCPRGSRR